MILRDYLAVDRTVLANERTLLAYIRTGLALLLTGGTMLELLSHKAIYFVPGIVMLSIGFIVILIGVFRFIGMNRTIRRSYRGGGDNSE